MLGGRVKTLHPAVHGGLYIVGAPDKNTMEGYMAVI